MLSPELGGRSICKRRKCGAPTRKIMVFKQYQIHMVAIGGSGMCGIAEVLLSLGHRVTGSDLKETTTTPRLASLGAIVHVGHDASNDNSPDVVVISSAVSSDNPEVVVARAKKIPVIP